MSEIIKDWVNRVNKIVTTRINQLKHKRLRWQLTRGRKSNLISTEDILTFTNSNLVITEMKECRDLSEVIIVIETSQRRYQFKTDRKSKSLIPKIESIIKFEKSGIEIINPY